MILKVVGTGSSGNCYVLQDVDKYLILDAGVNYQKILSAIHYDTRNVLGCLVTHEHLDHSCAVSRLTRYGIDCYGTPGTASAVPGVCGGGCNKDRIRTLGQFLVKEIPVNHDAAEPCGFLIFNQRTGERMLYATDTYYLLNRFPNIHYWLIECNYCDDLLTLDTNPALSQRLLTSHMSLDSLCKLFEANDLHDCRQIVLCHTSQERGDPERMVSTIHNLTHKPTFMAKAGLIVNLSLNPF